MAKKRERELTRRYEQALRAFDLRATQFAALSALAQIGPMPHGRLAEILSLERTTLTRVAVGMEERGLTTKRTSQKDERMHVLTITAKGVRALRLALPAWKRVQDEINKETTL